MNTEQNSSRSAISSPSVEVVLPQKFSIVYATTQGILKMDAESLDVAIKLLDALKKKLTY